MNRFRQLPLRREQAFAPDGRAACNPFPWALAVCLAFSTSLTSLAAKAEGSDYSASIIEEMTIVGEAQLGEQIPGSAHYLSAEQIERLGHHDIQRILRQIPGVSLQVEDGYGLRPNISIRGVATERSGRITLLEDNILIAPAPYSAPSAYYFPTMGRISAVEVLKGPAAITQGPYTIGGALNMISTPVPEEASGRVVAEAGQDATYRVHAHYGARLDNGFGFLLETHQWRSDGFQDIDRGGDSGLDVRDYTVKLSYAPADSRHRVELKLQYAEQDSDQTYLGLTDRDFGDDAFRRYGLSALDQIDTEHEQVILRYEFDITESFGLTAAYYYNGHERNWFKTEGIDFDGSTDAQSFSRTSWFNVIQAVNSGDALGGISNSSLQAILDGTADTAPGSIQLRSNAREYFSRGFQLTLQSSFNTGFLAHDVKFGARVHEDEEDRLQRNSTYSQIGGQLRLDDLGLLGNAGNRVQEAQAVSLYLHDRIQIGKWTFAPGLRYEDIQQKRTRWEIRDGRTSDPASRDSANFRDSRSNDTQIWLPGIGVVYQIHDRVAAFGGVHKGFTAPSNAPNVDPEEALNYELGVRFDGDWYRGELTGFISDYDNLLGECTASSGSDCVIGDAFNGDAATVRGVELLLGAEFSWGDRLSFPIELVYTHINSEFDTDIADTDFFGSVSAGDPIPYIPDNQLNLTMGVQGQKWDVFLAANYVDEVCVRASCGDFEQTDSTLTVDLSGSYTLTEKVQLFARVENLTGAEDILGRQPYGARPNKDTTASFGVRLAL